MAARTRTVCWSGTTSLRPVRCDAICDAICDTIYDTNHDEWVAFKRCRGPGTPQRNHNETTMLLITTTKTKTQRTDLTKHNDKFQLFHFNKLVGSRINVVPHCWPPHKQKSHFFGHKSLTSFPFFTLVSQIGCWSLPTFLHRNFPTKLL